MKKIFKILLIGFFVSFPIKFVQAESFPELPMAFYGRATLNGVNLPNGTAIRAYYGSESAGEIKVSSNGIYGYSEPTKQKLLVKPGVGSIIFKYVDSGHEATGTSIISYPGFSTGISIQKDLNFITSIPITVGGGGGGGGTMPPKQQALKKGDFNGDNAINIADFNGLMVEWERPGGKADFDGNERVDIYDFNFLMINWNK